MYKENNTTTRQCQSYTQAAINSLSRIGEPSIETMSSTQLADLLGKEKSYINREIKKMFWQKIDDAKIASSKDSRGYITDYHLPELESKMFVAKKDISYLEKITRFWINRGNLAQLPNFNDPVHSRPGMGRSERGAANRRRNRPGSGIKGVRPGSHRNGGRLNEPHGCSQAFAGPAKGFVSGGCLKINGSTAATGTKAGWLIRTAFNKVS